MTSKPWDSHAATSCWLVGKLPGELRDMIFRHSDRQDLFNLRRTSRTIEASATKVLQDLHARSLRAEYSEGGLTQLAQGLRKNKLLRGLKGGHMDICFEDPEIPHNDYHDHMNNLVTNAEIRAKIRLQCQPELDWECFLNPGLPWEAFSRMCIAHEDFFASKRDRRLLSKVFAFLATANVTLKVSFSSTTTHKPESRHAHSFPLSLAEVVQAVLGYRPEAANLQDIATSVILTARACGVCITALYSEALNLRNVNLYEPIMGPEYSIIYSTMSRRYALLTLAASLKELHLRHPLESEDRLIARNNSLRELRELLSACTQLRVLRLDFGLYIGEVHNIHHQIDGILSTANFPQLTTLALGNLKCSTTALERLLTRHQGLEDVQLYNIYLRRKNLSYILDALSKMSALTSLLLFRIVRSDPLDRYERIVYDFFDPSGRKYEGGYASGPHTLYKLSCLREEHQRWGFVDDSDV